MRFIIKNKNAWAPCWVNGGEKLFNCKQTFIQPFSYFKIHLKHHLLFLMSCDQDHIQTDILYLSTIYESDGNPNDYGTTINSITLMNRPSIVRCLVMHASALMRSRLLDWRGTRLIHYRFSREYPLDIFYSIYPTRYGGRLCHFDNWARDYPVAQFTNIVDPLIDGQILASYDLILFQLSLSAIKGIASFS